jgi:hypothetical protein
VDNSVGDQGPKALILDTSREESEGKSDSYDMIDMEAEASRACEGCNKCSILPNGGIPRQSIYRDGYGGGNNV